MSMPSSLSRLQSLLREQKEENERRKKKQEEEEEKRESGQGGQGRQISQAMLEKIYQGHGMMAPIQGFWQRPIPNDVYRSPISEPLTTLVPWKSLPRSVQEKYVEPTDGEEEIVEVYREDLLAAEVLEEEGGKQTQKEDQKTQGAGGGVSATQQQGMLNQRPLGGNLTNKLTEYTRGFSGQCRPFRPGGLDQADVDASKGNNNNINGTDEQVDPYTTPEAIENSRRVLEIGSKAAWEEGILLTAPPGVDFKVGISYKDVFGTADSTNVESNEQFDNDDDDDGNFDDGYETTANIMEQESAMARNSSIRIAPAIQWDHNLIDDDSLFGSSDEESEDDSDDDDEENDANKKQGDGKESNDNDGDGDDNDNDMEEDAIPGEQETANRTKHMESSLQAITGSDQDIDGLLAELSKAEARTKRELQTKKDDEDGIDMNPLQLAERQAQLQSNTTRKTWATTNLLPIHDFHALIPNPALVYPFTLDPFQQQAVARLERNESVFVAAHTSAGKTVVAEYACALAKQRGTRCVYTSPIKALSNQKFRDFSTKFGSENVGLITGDLQVNADDSTCLIMTTEILRSMLYRGADLIRDIEWVIFDEVHYVNDSERGVVWEEVIIMLPSYVNLIFLSATTPNTFEFSDWIGRTKKKPVHVIKTNYRPVPLSHHLWANLKLHKIMEGKSGFLDKGYKEASDALLPKSVTDKKSSSNNNNNNNKGSKPPPTKTGRGPSNMAWQAQGSKANWMSLIRYLEREDLTPTVVFSFSKKKCEEIANMLRSLDLNTASERGAVQGFTIQTVARLAPTDAVLPQVLTICEMVKRGIGVHHGGLLPILKEMVEILFSRNLIKVLFATETFAMGVNMPARSVVFNSIRKHDGTQFRVLEPGEYTQMAGRAGRRGLDKVGTVILCCFGETPPPIGILKNMLTGSSTMLRSQFRLTYNMILNLLRVEEMSVEAMIKRSFSEFATQRALTANEYPKLLARGKKTLAKLEEQFKMEEGQRVGAEDLDSYFSTCISLKTLNTELLNYITSSPEASVSTVLQPGRVVLVSAARRYGVVRMPGLIIQTQQEVGGTSLVDGNKKIGSLICMVLLPESYVDTSKDNDGGKSAEAKAAGIGHIGSANRRNYGIYDIKLDQILLISTVKKKIEPKLLYKDTKTGNRGSGGQSHGHASASFFGAKPLASRVDNPFAGMKARGKKDDDSFMGKKQSGTSSEANAIEKAVTVLMEAEKIELSTGLETLDLRENLKRGNDVVDLRRKCGEHENFVDVMRQHKSHRHPNLEKMYTLLERKHTLNERVEALDHLLSNESLALFPDFIQRKAVLRTLGYLDEHETVCVKGRVACEVNTCEELIVTEMVFEGVMNDLEPTEIVAALSALVYQQKSDDDELDMELPETLRNCCERMRRIGMNLGQLQKEHGLDVDPLDYTDGTLKFGLVHVVYEWALGVPFSNICQLTTAQEGSIVRCITRLDELCREVRNCARVVGNPTLYRKMEMASVAIKRDIVFASSLYVS